LGCKKKHRQNNHGFVPPSIIIQHAIQIARGMEYMHSQNIAHRDLKLANILEFHVDGESTLKITDFGISKPVSDIAGTIAGTATHMAPEIIDQCYDLRADIYSYGIVLWELWHSSDSNPKPYHDITPVAGVSLIANLLMEIRNGKRPKCDKNILPGYLALMKQCWDIDPNKRPTWTNIITTLSNLKIQ